MSKQNSNNGNGKGATVTPGANAPANAASKAAGAVSGSEGLNTVGSALLEAAGSEEGIAAILLKNHNQDLELAAGSNRQGEEQVGSDAEGESASTGGELETTEEEGEEGEEGELTTKTQRPQRAGEEEGTEGEGEGDTETETEEEAGTETDEADELPPKLQERINRRIGKEVAKRKALEERLETLEAQLAAKDETPEPARGKSQSGNPLDHVTKPAELERLKDEAEQIVEFTERSLSRMKRNPQVVAEELKGFGIKLTDASGEEDFSPERMEEYLSELQLRANQNLRRNIPKREKYLTEKAEWDAKAAETFPYLKNKQGKEYQESRRILEQFPELKLYPKHEAMVGVYMLGLKEMRRLTAEWEAKQGKGQVGKSQIPKPALKAPPKLNGSRMAVPVVNGKEARRVGATKDLVDAGGSEDALTRMVETML